MAGRVWSSNTQKLACNFSVDTMSKPVKQPKRAMTDLQKLLT